MNTNGRCCIGVKEIQWHTYNGVIWLRSKTWAENGMFFSWQASKAVKRSPSWESLRWSMEWGALVMEYASWGCLDHTGRQASVSGCGACSEESNEDIWRKSVAFKKRGWGPQGSWRLIFHDGKEVLCSLERGLNQSCSFSWIPTCAHHPPGPKAGSLPRVLSPASRPASSLCGHHLALSLSSLACLEAVTCTRHYLLLVLHIVCFPELPPTSKNARGATRFCGDRNSFNLGVFL